MLIVSENNGISHFLHEHSSPSELYAGLKIVQEQLVDQDDLDMEGERESCERCVLIYDGGKYPSCPLCEAEDEVVMVEEEILEKDEEVSRLEVKVEEYKKREGKFNRLLPTT